MSDDSSNRTDVSTIHLDNISLQNRENVDTNTKFMGFDLSTQQVCHQVSVDFDSELSEYKTRGGVYKSDDGSNTVSAPVNMWLKALDLTMDKLKIDGLDFSTVLGISGCAQQHGSVWWRRESGALLRNLNPDEFLHKELVNAFSLRETPIWMDSSTSEQCRLLEAHVGGPARLAQLTGSRAYERFTGAQIAKVYQTKREVYLITERITLISNFLASILIGSYAPLDASDASGMNMMDIRRKRWSDECLEGLIITTPKLSTTATTPTTATIMETLETTATTTVESRATGAAMDEKKIVDRMRDAELAGLRARLGCSDGTPHVLDNNIVDTHEIVGRVSRYFVERYGFAPECLVSSFTGDNPASMAGLCVKQDELILSLGTSDTAFFWLDEPQPGENGHVLRNPLDDKRYMGLICFKNGSKTRERIRNECANGDWNEFARLLESVPRGNFGNIGFYFDLREIFPLAKGDFRFNSSDQLLPASRDSSRPAAAFSPEIEIRACLEGQFMRLYHHARALGLDMARIRRVLVTGGASQNAAILQVIADIFKSPVYTLESLANSACLGGAYLAKYAYELEQQKLDQSFGGQQQQRITTSNKTDDDDDEDNGGGKESDNKTQQLVEVDNQGEGEHDEGKGKGETRPGELCDDLQMIETIRREKRIDFSQMILGHTMGSSSSSTDGNDQLDEDDREINLVKMAEPTAPIGSQQDVYEKLLERYVKLETLIGQMVENNDESVGAKD